MDSGGDVAALAVELARAVEVTMDPTASQQDRMEAYVACERFKEVSPLCAQAGLYLSNGPYTSIVKHFGLQLMEHTVKFKWNTITQQEKLFIKENSMKLLYNGVGPAEDFNLSHIKDALTRIIVEMIKREWPQQWTTLLSELSDACNKGEAQTELVLLIFLRLVEDVALLQTIESNQRRKDIYQALTVNMAEIFNFFLRLIELHVNCYRNTTAILNQQKALAHRRVVQVVLITLSGFVEWVSIQHIMSSNGRLLQILCILLNDKEFQLSAAECLLQIVSRKGQVKDRKPLTLLFSEEAISCIYRAANNNTNTENDYIFLKKLVQVLAGLGTQLTGLWGKEDGIVEPPQNFSTFLETILIFTRHPSLTLSHNACLIWNCLLKHEQISKDQIFIDYIPKVINIIGPKIIKITYPLQRPIGINMDPRIYASIDYDSEEEFTIFFHRCRTDFLEFFRQSTLIAPIFTFSYCEHWLNLRLQKSINESNTSCSIQDPVYLEWEALVAVIDGVLSRILLVTERPNVANGLRLLESCLKINTNNPLILSILLSCISALFVFLSMSSCQITSGNCVTMSGVTLLPRVLEKIFAALIFPIDINDKLDKVNAIKNLRRHSASLMVKLGYKYPLLLLPVFEQINTTVQNLIRQNLQLNKILHITLIESLLLISNHFCDYERQTAFVADIINDAQKNWLQLLPILKTTRNFINFIGLDKTPNDNINNDINGVNRQQIIYSLNLVLGVIKRCSWPDDPDRANRGGFVVGLTESGNPICRNPATPHVVPILPHILSLLRVLNELFNNESIMLLSDGYKNANSILDNEKKNLMGISPVLIDPMDPSLKKVKTPLEKMQQFLTTIFENCYHMMGAAGPSLGRDLYQLPGIAEALIGSAFASLDNVPDYRLRSIIRVFLKPFVYSCPPAFYETVLLPIFAHISPFMLNRLTNRWKYITSLYESGELGDDINDTQEVVEDMLNRALTREYLDVLKVGLVGGALTVDRNDRNENLNEVIMDQDNDHSMDGQQPSLTRAAQSAMTSEVISELGSKLLRCSATCNPIVLNVLSVLSWNDSNSSLKATYLTGPIVRFLSTEQLLTASLASNILIAVLQGLQLHGQHESNQSSLITLGVQVYEILRPQFPNIIDVMQQIPNINQTDLQKLDEKILLGINTKGNKIDKAKKDLFKKITGQLIVKNIGQLFRKEIKIINLPPINNTSRNFTSHNILNDNSQESGLTQLFTTRS